MGLLVEPVSSENRLPSKVDVAVIGGGIVGASAAHFLAKRGVNVALCDKGNIAGEQSSRNWGWIRQARRDPRELPLMVESLRLWERMNEELEFETGFHRSGILFAADNDENIAQNEAWLEKARQNQIEARMVSGPEIKRLIPGADKRWRAGLFCATDGRAEPHLATTAVALAARRSGASVLTNCAVRGLELSAGRVSGIITEHGRIFCSTVVLAAGAWSRRFLKDLDITLPQLKVLGSVMRTSRVDDGPEAALWSSEFALRKRIDGGYTIANGNGSVVSIVPDSFRFFANFLPALRSDFKNLRLRVDGRFIKECSESRPIPPDRISPYERTRVLDPAPDKAGLRTTFDKLKKAFPVFASATVVQQWAGLMDVTPDAIPVISQVDAVPGLIVATGFSGHGFGIAPGAGRLAADLVIGTPPVVDPTDFRFSRFSDGTRVRR
ncbi:FAD-binding oxidoreductase [Mesorhizobium sp.]|uniref:NAD(P)/FAD-dependent oxidoreductase n=2 Tax=unclassified Mesorhizobium TaxID=325217 RepID=UPI0012167088|nr:FAD-binding oxidoreductase [Mesorhizobium sp.]TIX21650.1 MAG: FAD-binding oxidoreductase [Mesorhizobium sp.]